MLWGVTLSPIDFERALTLRVEEVVARFHSPVTYRHLGGGVFEFTDTLSRQTFRRLVIEARTLGGKQPKKIMTIDVTKIDTTGFASLFEKIGTIQAGLQYDVPVGFHARDGSVHFVAAKFLNGGYASTDFYKWVAGKDTLEAVAQLEGEWFYPFAQGTVFSGSLPNIGVDSFGTVMIFDTPPEDNLPTRRRTVRLGRNETAQIPRLYDFDGDGVAEIVLRQWPPLNMIIAKYDSVRGVTRDVFANDFNMTMAWGSWAVGDFDMDAKGECATATLGGFVYFVENGATDSSYSITFTDTTRSQNAGFNCEGNDLDGDGSPESIIGSGGFGSFSNLAVYERIGDNDFEVSLWLEIKGVGGLTHFLSSGDVDGDGRDELLVCLGGVVLVLKATGDDDYRLMWMKAYPHETGIRVFDVNGDGIQEAIIALRRVVEPFGGFTEIYSFQASLYAGDAKQDKEAFLEIFPQPIRSNGMARVSIPYPGLYSLSVYSITGMRVMTYSGKDYSGTGVAIPFHVQSYVSGVYYTVLNFGDKTITKKMLVMH